MEKCFLSICHASSLVVDPWVLVHCSLWVHNIPSTFLNMNSKLRPKNDFEMYFDMENAIKISTSHVLFTLSSSTVLAGKCWHAYHGSVVFLWWVFCYVWTFWRKIWENGSLVFSVWWIFALYQFYTSLFILQVYYLGSILGCLRLVLPQLEPLREWPQIRNGFSTYHILDPYLLALSLGKEKCTTLVMSAII